MTMSVNKLKENIINWHKNRYPTIDNVPNEESVDALNDLCLEVLMPIQKHFGDIHITYGFTSHNLLSQIKKLNPTHIAPNIDQHASYEVNTKGNLICNRGGAACDIFIAGYESNMYEIAKWAASNLPFDRMYLYGNNRPFHISFGSEHNRFIQVMKTSKTGKRFPGKRGTNIEFDFIVGDIDEY